VDNERKKVTVSYCMFVPDIATLPGGAGGGRAAQGLLLDFEVRCDKKNRGHPEVYLASLAPTPLATGRTGVGIRGNPGRPTKSGGAFLFAISEGVGERRRCRAILGKINSGTPEKKGEGILTGGHGEGSGRVSFKTGSFRFVGAMGVGGMCISKKSARATGNMERLRGDRANTEKKTIFNCFPKPSAKAEGS